MWKLFYFPAFLGSLIGGYSLFAAVFETSAPKQAAAAAIGVGFAVIPYVFGRVIEKMGPPREVKIDGPLPVYIEPYPAKPKRPASDFDPR